MNTPNVTLLGGPRVSRVGDWIQARIERPGQHRHLEFACGRRVRPVARRGALRP
ncbi:hypothetical protein [Aromatoleum evansii]|uniref:hypothetical protein n=1 Tax=Aromatoleum evansii TaxID=59406 RepID=UPI001B7CE4D4|nr:hypothetical protein [Aromatoleum evansii]